MNLLRGLFAALALVCAVVPTQAVAARRPNVIIVFIDDMGWSDLSCFGGQRVNTKAIDQLAAEGIRFTNFYVNSPICSPSRVALTTGQYPQRWRITSFLNNRRNNEERGMAQWLDPTAPVLARQLKQAGYATGHFGKWHMGGQRDVDNAPPISDYGFDQSLTNFEGMGPKLLPLVMQPDWKKPRKIWRPAERLGGPFTWTMRSKITQGFVQPALSFIDQATGDGKPFYINVWPDDVHGPFFPEVEDWSNNPQERYHAVLDAMDQQLAPLFDRVRNDPQLASNTLILFCSDNGPQHGAGSSAPLRGAKTWLYEGGVRSPLIAWGPGLLANDSAGTTNTSSIFSAIDLNRSLYSICGVEIVKDGTLDGEDLANTLLGKKRESRTKPIFWRRPPDRPGFDHGFDEDNPDLAVRHGRWKYHENYDGAGRQLYDLDSDVSESSNIVNDHPEVAARLHKAVTEWNATMPPDAGSAE